MTTDVGRCAASRSPRPDSVGTGVRIRSERPSGFIGISNATLRSLGGARVTDKPASPDNGVLAGHFGPIGDPGELAQRLAAIPGVVEHGLFPPATGGAHHLPG